MKNIAKSVALAGFVAAAILATASAVRADDEFAHPESYKFDGGPLGELKGNAAVDGYFFWQSGAGDGGSAVGNHATGAKVGAWEVEVRKKQLSPPFGDSLSRPRNTNRSISG